MHEGPDFLGRELRRVVLAPKHREQPIQVLSVERYEDGLIVRYLMPGGMHVAKDPDKAREEMAVRPMGGASLFVTDDVGTRYFWKGGHGGGGPGPEGRGFRGDSYFVPAVPAAATQLTVTTEAGPVTLPLQG